MALLDRLGGRRRRSRRHASSPELTYVTQWYAPEPFHAPEWTVRGLASRGWDVTVLTGVPNYPDGVVQAGYSPWRPSTEDRAGQRVVRAPLFPSHDSSALRRLLNYVSWAVSASVVGLPALSKASVAYVYSSPATAALPAMVARVLLGRRFVLSVQDVWPDSVFASGFLTRGLLRKVAEAGLTWFVDLSYRWADHITVISPGMRGLLLERGVPPEKVTLVYNWVDEDLMRPSPPDIAFREQMGLSSDDFVLVYAGNHGKAQGLHTAVQAVGRLPPSSRVHLVMIGGGVEKEGLRQLAADVAPARVHFLDPIPPDRVPEVTASCDLQLVCLVEHPLFHITMPSKVQSILALGQPVVVSAPGDAARVVRDGRAGFTAAPGDVESLMRVLTEASQLPTHELRRLGENGLRIYREQMSSEVGTRRLDAVLRAVVDRHSSSHDSRPEADR